MVMKNWLQNFFVAASAEHDQLPRLVNEGWPASGNGPDHSDPVDADFLQMIQNIPAAVYTTDAAGRITFYNEAAAALWGRRPKLGEDWWCGSWRLYWPDGAPMAHDECPMAVTLKTGKAVRGVEAIAERPNGERYPFIPYPTPLFDAKGKLTGAVNLLIDITDRKRNEEAAQRLAAIVACSDDAIVSKDVDGVITSWNEGAERIFGYTAEEIIGRSITVLIPTDRQDEEPGILRRILRGDRIEHYETVRQRKDGSRIDISLTVSPIKNAEGKIIGASKIARDITDRKRLDEQLRQQSARLERLNTAAQEEIERRRRAEKRRSFCSTKFNIASRILLELSRRSPGRPSAPRPAGPTDVRRSRSGSGGRARLADATELGLCKHP